jgi:hypothetical protein
VSRTKHHRSQKNQHGGHDLWSRRPCAGMSYSAYNKQLTRKRERAAEPEIIQKEISDFEDPNHGCCYVCGVPHAWEPDETECEEYIIMGLYELKVER